MYAQKQHHDLILKPKKLIKGDLVLVYSLKPHLGKFKKRGFGPCVIEEISSSGAVKLSTLDGEIMSNWISGYCIKKYHLPLTNDMLERMHVAKNRKEAAKQQKVESQAEAKEQIKKIKQRRTIIVAILPQGNNVEEQHPYIPIQVETQDRAITTLVD